MSGLGARRGLFFLCGIWRKMLGHWDGKFCFLNVRWRCFCFLEILGFLECWDVVVLGWEVLKFLDVTV